MSRHSWAMVFEDVLLLKNSCMRFSGFTGKRVLLLQGPVGPFFWNLSKDLQKRGADVFKFNFNAGDALFYPADSNVKCNTCNR